MVGKKKAINSDREEQCVNYVKAKRGDYGTSGRTKVGKGRSRGRAQYIWILRKRRILGACVLTNRGRCDTRHYATQQES